LAATEIRQLLEQRWAPAGVQLRPWDPETAAAVIRITKFPGLNRLLTQIERILEINSLTEVTKAVCGGGAREPGDRRGVKSQAAASWRPHGW
jgi:hypothetical protein